MATIVELPPDPRITAIEKGVSGGVENFFAARTKRKLQQKFSDAFKKVDKASTYEDAVKSVADIDPEIMAEPGALEAISKHIDQRFPEQEQMEVFDPSTRQRSFVTHRKGSPPSPEELAKTGKVRPQDVGLGNYFAFDEKTEDIVSLGETTAEEAKKNAKGRDVVRAEDLQPSASLLNAFANMRSARAQERAASAKENKEDRATQFEQEVDATAQRLGLDPTDSTQRNQAINVVSNRESTLKNFREFFTKNVNNEIFFTEDIARGHIANSERIMDPALSVAESPEQARQVMLVDAYFNIANDESLATANPEVGQRASADFLRLTGFAPKDQILKNIVKEQQVQMEEGETKIITTADKTGKPIDRIRLIKLGGRVIPLARIPAE